MTYASSQAKGQIGATGTGLRHSHTNTRSKQHLWTAPQLMAIPSLTHWVRQGIEPTSSWILVRFVSAELQWEIPHTYFFIFFLSFFLSFFLGLQVQHMEVPRPGVESELQLPATATANATDGSHGSIACEAWDYIFSSQRNTNFITTQIVQWFFLSCSLDLDKERSGFRNDCGRGRKA